MEGEATQWLVLASKEGAKTKACVKETQGDGKHGYDCLRLHVYMQMEEYISQKQAARVSPKRPNIQKRKAG